jgi:hypothetical protein
MAMAGPDNRIPLLVDIGRFGGTTDPYLVWRFDEPMLAISSAILGGGIGPASWVINVSVEPDYSRTDPVEHLADIADALGFLPFSPAPGSHRAGCGGLIKLVVIGAVSGLCS